METIILKMTSAYDNQDFYKDIPDCHILNFKNLSGTRCYLDDSAKDSILHALGDFDYNGIHFIDSGNYHYLTLLWLMKIKEDFNLVLFDHHSDNQPPSFGDITSCGGWVLEATEKLKNLHHVYTYGVGEEIPISDIPTDLPLYISIDKDVLCTADSITDWDQGEMTLEELLADLKNIFSNHTIIGVDICGDSGEQAFEGAFLNNQTNATLFDFLHEKF